MDAKVLGGQEFDVSPTGPEPAEVGKTIARCLAVRGFCRINPDIKQDLLEQALQDVQEAEAQLRFRRPCAEFREGLLGESGSWRIAELALPGQPEESAKTNSARAGGPGVQALDRLLSIVQATAEPLFPSVLGFDAPHRTAGLLHEVSPPLDDLQTDQGFSGSAELDDAECSRWLEVFMRHRVMCLLFLGPLPCTLELQPFGEESEEAEPFQLQASPGSLVLVRADTLSHRVRQQLPQGIERAYCLSCFYSEDTASASRHPYRAQVSTPCVQALQQWMLQRLSAVRAAQQEGEDYMATAGRLQAQRKDTASAQGVPISEPVVRKVSEEEEKEELLEVKWTPLESPVSTAQLQGLGRVLFVGAGAELQEAIAPLFPGAEFSGAAEVVSEGCWDNVVFVAAVDDYEEIPEMDVLCAALKVAQACISLSETTAVSGSIEGGTGSRPLQWWITRGTQAVGPGGSYLNAGLWGMARTFRMEQPGLGLRCLDLGPNVLGSDAVAAELASWLGLLTAATGRTNVAGELDAVDAAGQPENEVAVRTSDSGEDQAFVARLTQSSTKLRRPMCLEMPSRGSLTNLRLAPQEKRRKPQEGQAEIRVRAIGLNFRDVLNVMGLYPGDPGHPGADTSGTVTATAADVSHIRCGDDVFGESLGCLNTYNTGTAALLTAKPASWSYEAASSIPVIFVTVEEPFADIAKVKKGDKVLIHAAAGGVGLVAIQYCQFVGAEVYATAGSEEKHAYLRSLGVKRITTTRDGQRFEDDMKRFLQEDEIDGIDVVLNSLTHDDYVGRSLRLLAHGGKFMEISKRDVWSHEEMRNARPDVLYTKIAADQMMFEEPWRFNAYLQRLLKRVEDGGLSHINMHIHEGLENAIAALQFLQKALNMGKVVISNPSMMGCRPDAAYVISGGTGSLGVVSAQFLVEEGAKFISLLTRSGRVVQDVQDKWEWLQASSATVQIRVCDVSSRDSVGELARVLDSEGQVRRPPTLVGGVLHLAFLLDDAFIPDLTRKHLESTFAGKVFGARHLHDSFVQTSRALDFMVLFSSTSTVFGVPRQANYSAANASIDAHARVWRQRGESACSIQFGPWREVGLAVKIGAVGVLKSKGFGSLSNAFGMAALASCSLIAAPGSSSTIMANPMYWAKYLKQYAAVPPFFSEFSPGQAQPPELEARDALPILPQWWQKAMNHVSFAGQSVAVSGAACKCPVGWKPDVWFRSLCAGTDFVVEVPASRWDHSQVYNPDPDGWKDYKTFCRHGAFMEGIELFDHRNFNVSKAEAVIMDPTQRSILEVGYEALCSAAW
ncbi:unnamed protein product [Polarella glacialis]|uniref:Enoyl reductase (ER) domain-containing protein n=2 Tax=Polarella glacialis TaxID=89957 RepID=A0A813DZ96_POLGL|nr:unnamed protein product [Polarella glacialis]